MKTETELLLNTDLLRKGRMVLRAINHTLRQQMLEYIHAKGRVNVTDIYVHFRIEQSVASQQLAILRREDFVKTERQQKMIFYSVNLDRIKDVQEKIQPLVGSRS